MWRVARIIIFGLNISALFAAEPEDPVVPVREIYVLKGHKDPIDALAFSPDGSVLVSSAASYDSFGGGRGDIRFWDTKTGKGLGLIKTDSDNMRSITFRAKDAIVAATDHTYLRINFDGKDWQAERISLRDRNERFVAFSGDGKLLITSFERREEKKIRVYETIDLKLRSELEPRFDPAALSKDGSLWVVFSKKTVDLVKIDGAEIQKRIPEPENELFTVITLGAAGNILFTRSVARDDPLMNEELSNKILDLKTGNVIAELGRKPLNINAASFSPDDRILASGDVGGTLSLWNARTGSLLASDPGHAKTISVLLFSPDGKCLASGSFDKTIRLWNVSARQP